MANSSQSADQQKWVQAAHAVKGYTHKDWIDKSFHFVEKMSELRPEAWATFKQNMKEKDYSYKNFGLTLSEFMTYFGDWEYFCNHYLNDLFLNPEALDIFFGLGNENSQYFASYTHQRFLEDVSRANLLLERITELFNEDLDAVEEQEAVAEEEPEQEERKSEAAGAVVPVGNLGKSEEEKSDEKQQEEKDPEQVKTALEQVIKGDAALRKEVVRMQQMVARQLASMYGIPDSQVDAFAAAMAGELGPHIYFELSQLGYADLAEAFKSPAFRHKIYLQVLLRAQQNPKFQAILQQQVLQHVQAVNGLRPDEVDEVLDVVNATPEERVQVLQTKSFSTKQQTLLTLLTKVNPNEIAKNIQFEDEKTLASLGLSAEDIEAIQQTFQRKPSQFEQELRMVLGVRGAGLTETQINAIVHRLQAYAITGVHLESISEAEFERLFGEGFGSEADLILGRIKKAFAQSPYAWTRVAAAYVRNVKIELAEITGNSGVLFGSQVDVPGEAINDTQKKIGIYGAQAVALSRNASLQQIVKAVLDGKASGSGSATLQRVIPMAASVLPAMFGKSPPKVSAQTLNSAVGLKKETTASLLKLLQANPAEIQAMLRTLGISEKSFDEKHIAEAQAFFAEFLTTKEGIEKLANEWHIEVPQFLQMMDKDGKIWNAVENKYNEIMKEDSFLQKTNKKIDRELGKTSFIILVSTFTTPAGGAAVSKAFTFIEKIQLEIEKIPVIGKPLAKILDFFLWNTINSLGKLVKYTLVAIGGILGIRLVGSVATGYAMGSAAVGLSSSGAAAAAGSAISSGVIAAKSAIGGFLAGAKSALAGIGNAVNAGVSGLSGLATGGMFTGAVAIAGVSGFMAMSWHQHQLLLSSLLTNRTAVRQTQGVGSLGCWPVGGVITGMETYCINGQRHLVSPGGSAVDIAANNNQQVYSPFAGSATFLEVSGSYGRHVVLHADNGFTFIFGHLRDFGNFAGSEGQVRTVVPGDVIGVVNETGNSDGAHLHYEVIGARLGDFVPDPVIQCGMTVSSSCAGARP